SVIVRVNHAGSASDLVSSALATATSGGIACSKGSATTGLDGVTTCGGTLQNTSIAAGDWIETKTGSGFASSGAKRLSVCLTCLHCRHRRRRCADIDPRWTPLRRLPASVTGREYGSRAGGSEDARRRAQVTETTSG